MLGRPFFVAAGHRYQATVFNQCVGHGDPDRHHVVVDRVFSYGRLILMPQGAAKITVRLVPL